MCNITKKLRRKTATMYKVVVKITDSYYSFFAGMKIAIGKVNPTVRYINPNLTSEYSTDIIDVNDKLIKSFIYEALNDFGYYGKISGFETYDAAKRMAITCANSEYNHLVVILKIKVTGEIWKGDATKICDGLDTETTLFGTEVLEFKETKFRLK